MAMDQFGRPVAPGAGVLPPAPFGVYGPAPGRAVSTDNSISIVNNGPNQSDYQVWREAQNSRIALNTYADGAKEDCPEMLSEIAQLA
ncbi:hypothetical protein [Mycobacterium dioxanotrophicus]|uniref:hypothetical protein n=1 Tax=Mycobacterium dioxanotrophicus TaxID=482462 RepID=UPI0012FCA099|nr:hypothetical protein [Mycobacterium dioxanotrophicus]